MAALDGSWLLISDFLGADFLWGQISVGANFLQPLLRFITDDEVRVIFWDYGDMQDMNISDLKELPMQYMTVPKQALHVQISNDVTADTLEDLKNCLGVKQIDDKGSLILFYFERNSKTWKKF